MFDIELVGKVGSMALVNQEHDDINYNILARISRELRPGYIWVTSGATEIGRLDFIKRNGKELPAASVDDNKTDYAAQGQSVLMQNYRSFIDPRYSVRQFLVEHQHFNDVAKCRHIREALLRASVQGAIPIVNYNDPVSDTENRKMEIRALRLEGIHAVECVDNDETASQIACLVKPKFLLILSNVDGILKNVNDPKSLIPEIGGKDIAEVIQNIDATQQFCYGASRVGANGAKAKLEYIKEPIKCGTTVILANSKYGITATLNGTVPRTVIKVR